MFSAQSPSPSSYSLHPPLSPGFYPILSPLLPPSSAASSSSFQSSSSSRRSTSPLLLSALPPNAASSSLSTTRSLSTSVDTLSTSFLTDVAIHDTQLQQDQHRHHHSTDLPPLHHSSHLDAASSSAATRQLPTLPRSVFGPSLSASLSAQLAAMAHDVLLRTNSSFDEIPSSAIDTAHRDELTHSHSHSHPHPHSHSDELTEQAEQSEEAQPFRLAIELLSDVVVSSSVESATERTPPVSPQSAEAGKAVWKKKERSAEERNEKRVSRACIHCSASKTKCDNKRPCDRCIRTKRAATCQDIPRRKRTGRAKRRREVEKSDASDTEHTEKLLEAIKKEEVDEDEDDEQTTSSAAATMAICTTPGAPEMTSTVITYSSHTALSPHEPYVTGFASPSLYPAQSVQASCDCSSPPAHYMPPAYPAYWPASAHAQFQPHTHSHSHAHSHSHSPHPQPHSHHPHAHPHSYTHLHPHHATQSVFASHAHRAPASHDALYPPRHVHTAQPTPLLSPVHSAINAPTAVVGPTASSPNSPATPRSSASSPSVPVIPIGQMLSRLRLRLPRALHRAHAAVIDQFHQWADLLALRQQQGLTAPVPLFKARQYVYHMLKDAMVALEDEDRQRRMAAMLAGINSSSSSPPPPIFSPPLESEHDELLRLIHREWHQYLFPSNAAEDGGEDAHGIDWQTKDKVGPPTLDAVLQRRVVIPTFIIPLLSFPFLASAPWLSASFSSLLGYPAASLSACTLSPLDLLHRRQHADIAPLVPAFLSAITSRAEHYLHSSGWIRQGGDSIQLMANVRVMYAEGTGYPVALMAQFTRKEEADASFAPILARMENGGSVVPPMNPAESVGGEEGLV